MLYNSVVTVIIYYPVLTDLSPGHLSCPCSASSICGQPWSLGAKLMPGPPLWCWHCPLSWLCPGSSPVWLPHVILNFGLTSCPEPTIFWKLCPRRTQRVFCDLQPFDILVKNEQNRAVCVLLISQTFNYLSDREIKTLQRSCPHRIMNLAVVPAGGWDGSWRPSCLVKPGQSQQSQTSHSLCTNQIRTPICAPESPLRPLWYPETLRRQPLSKAFIPPPFTGNPPWGRY